jgi:hypothetical protein
MNECQSSESDPLFTLEGKRQLIRDRVHTVAGGYQSGLYLWGEGGTSKSFTVEEALGTTNRAYKVTNSRLTARGLYELLRDQPDAIHVLEDVETLFKDKNSFGVLRSSLWGQVGTDGLQVRKVDWKVAGRPEEFIFTGGLIMISNCPLDEVPQLRAFKTRITTLHFHASYGEVTAFMRKIASQGHRHGPYSLTPEECLEVAEEVIVRSQQLQRQPDLRLLINAFADRLQWANGASETHWKDLLDSALKERVIATADTISRAARKENELAIARRIAHLPRKERLEVWQKETGKSEPALYRCLKLIQPEKEPPQIISSPTPPPAENPPWHGPRFSDN